MDDVETCDLSNDVVSLASVLSCCSERRRFSFTVSSAYMFPLFWNIYAFFRTLLLYGFTISNMFGSEIFRRKRGEKKIEKAGKNEKYIKS